MILIHFVAMFLLVLSFSVFFYINIFALMAQYNKMKESCFMTTGSFFEKIKYFSLTEKELTRLNIICALIFCLIGLYLRIGIFGVIFGFALGWYLPGMIFGMHRKRYYKKMDDQIFSALILLGNAMKAGDTLPQAIDSTKGVLVYPISQEFDIVSRQIRMGMTVSDALEDFANRIPLDDLELAVKAMTISLKTGANLPVALKRIADTIRSRNMLHGKINALTVQGKAQGIVVGLLPVFLGGFLYWSDPDYMKVLFSTFIGNCVIAMMIVLEVIAFFCN